MFKSEQISKSGFIIAEVGQNHQGDIELARKYIKIFAEAGADAVKFQTRNNKYLFSESAYNNPYTSENAFSEVYGLHREKLELNLSDLAILKKDCNDLGVKFMSTPFDEPSLDFLSELNIDILKIASFDLGNLPFINKIAQKKIPTVISIGGGKHDQIVSSVDLLKKYLDESMISILHCVSEYPCDVNKLGLDNIVKLKLLYPEIQVGLSDHFNGTLSGPIGFMKGARVFEKHVTLNRSWKGTDHSFALEPEGFRKFVRDIRRVPLMMPEKNIQEIGLEKVFMKLGKSIVAIIDLKRGDTLTIDNLSGKIFDKQYIPVRESNTIIGHKINCDIKKGDPILRTYIQD